MANNTAHKPENRPERTPVAERNRLSFKNQDPNYVYRLVNDVENRIEDFKNAGYEVVTNGDKVGESRAGEGTGLGSAVTKQVGQGITGVLMRIRKEWYEEDQKRHQRNVREVESSLHDLYKKKDAGFYGSLKIDKS